MKITDIMARDVVTAAPDDTTAGAAKRMRSMHVGCLVVTVGNTVKGMVTDRDLLKCLAEAHDPLNCKVSRHMTRPVIVIRPEEEIVTAAEIMGERGVNRLPVAMDGRLVGLVSFSDISRLMDVQAQALRAAWISLSKLIHAESRQAGRPATRSQ